MARPGQEFFPFFLLFLLFSCGKNDDADSGKICIGNYHAMAVDSTEKTIEASYNNFDELILDPDRDDTADLRMVVAMYGSPGMGIHYVSEMQVLNDGVGIDGFFTLDTTFLERKIRIYEDDYNVYKSIVDNYSCRRKNLSDEIVGTRSEFYPVELKLNDVLSLSGLFAADTISFIYYWESPVYTYVENDTIIIRSGSTEKDCHRLPYGEAIYLGFRVSGDRERLGWIKMVLSSGAIITVKEVALES